MARWSQRTAWFAIQDKGLQTWQNIHLPAIFLSYNKVSEVVPTLIYRQAFFELLFPLGISISSPRNKLVFSNIEFKKEHTYPDCIGLFYLCLSNSPPAEHKEDILRRQHRREEQWQLGAIQSKEGHLQEVSSPSMAPSPTPGSLSCRLSLLH